MEIKILVFFHKCASQQRKVNFINKLEREDGSFIEDPQEITSIAKGFFDDLFTLMLVSTDMSRILLGVNRCVTVETNVELTKVFTEEEIMGTVKYMGPIKAPRLDRFPAPFLKKCWNIVGKEVSNFYLNILNNGSSLELLKAMNIILIPKVPNPSNMSKLHPIIFFNVI